MSDPALAQPRRLTMYQDTLEQRLQERASAIMAVREFLRLRRNENGSVTLTPIEADQLFLMLHV